LASTWSPSSAFDSKQRFLRHKRIELKLLEPVAAFEMPGVHVVRHEQYELVVDVDTRVQPIEAAVARLMGGAHVADVSIEDPPLEEIIAAMYLEGSTA
jgi:ABC-2 type transport system ATP-binding protein